MKQQNKFQSKHVLDVMEQTYQGWIIYVEQPQQHNVFQHIKGDDDKLNQTFKLGNRNSGKFFIDYAHSSVLAVSIGEVEGA